MLVSWSVVGQCCVCVGLLISCGAELCLCWFLGQLWDSIVCVGLLVSCGTVLCLCWFLVSCGAVFTVCVGLWVGCGTVLYVFSVGLSEVVDSFVFNAGLSELVDSVAFSVGLSEQVDSVDFGVYQNWWTVLALVLIFQDRLLMFCVGVLTVT